MVISGKQNVITKELLEQSSFSSDSFKIFVKCFHFCVTISNESNRNEECRVIVYLLSFYPMLYRMDKRKSFVFTRQYRNCFFRRINALVPRNQPIKTAVGIVMHDFHGLKTMTFHRVADLAYF